MLVPGQTAGKTMNIIFKETIPKDLFLALEAMKYSYSSAETLCDNITEDAGVHTLALEEHQVWQLGRQVTEDNSYDLEDYGLFCGAVPCVPDSYDLLQRISEVNV